MARSLITLALFATLLLHTHAQFEFLPEFSRNKLLQFLRSLQDATGPRFFTNDGGPTEVQVIVHSPSEVITSQQFFRRQDNQVQFQPQPQFQQPRFQPQPQPRPQFQRQPQFQPQSQPQFQPQPQPQFQPQPQPQPQFQPQPQPQPQFQPQPQPQPQFQPQPQPQPQFQPQPQPQPQFQPQPQPQPQFQQQLISTTQRPRPTPLPIIESTTLLNISENFVQQEAESRQQQQPQQPQKVPQFIAPGSGRWLLQQDPACLTCICETASGCDETLQCDSRGFCGPFLLSKRYWTLAGKPLLRGDNPDREGASADCLRDPICAAEAVRGYLDRFAQDCDGNRRVDCLDLARIHFQGPFNCRAPPFEYMDTFRRCWDRAVRSRNLTR